MPPKKCIAGKRRNHSSQEIHAPIGIHICQSSGTMSPSTYRTHPARRPRSCHPVPVNTSCRTRPSVQARRGHDHNATHHNCRCRSCRNPQRPVTSGHAIRVVSTHSSTRHFALLSAHRSLTRWFAVESGFLDPTTAEEGFGYSLRCLPSFSSWRGRSPSPQSFYSPL